MKKINATSSDFWEVHNHLYRFIREKWSLTQVAELKRVLVCAVRMQSPDEQKAFSMLFGDMRTAITAMEELNLRQSSALAVLLFHAVSKGCIQKEEIASKFDSDVEIIVNGLIKVNAFSDKKSSAESENYLKLLLSMAEDIRVVFLIIAQHLRRMRDAREYPQSRRLSLAVDSAYLYAPLAHRLGLYTIKSELEDLSLKYTDRITYDFVARKLNETKRSRDLYIDSFIEPLNQRLKQTGLKYEIKGRTKSIHSIHQKLKKQKIEFENIYDLFAIRIILDSPRQQEKEQCWQVYSIVTDMYQPNPKRLKDWLSIPKSNGYESLHITVMGPQSRWVEVQIRTTRMDEIAERGLAAHWKYKGVKDESTLDEWLSTLRESLDSGGDLYERLGDFKLDLYDEEIFVFTPKGDLFKLPKGATVLDFAFSIHTALGASCVSGRVNGKNVPIKHTLKSGDTVEVQTSSHQTPKQDWLSFVVTGKARTKIRQLLKEEANKQVDLAKEALSRRMKNRKIDPDEAILMQLIKKMHYKNVTDFYINIATQKLDINRVIDDYLTWEEKEKEGKRAARMASAEEFVLKEGSDDMSSRDELIIDQNLRGVEYTLAKCCNPIFGDDIFGFVSSQGIKIHRMNCPNAQNLFSHYGYRVLNARWSRKSSSSSEYIIVLRVIGNDRINIVSSLISIISKEEGVGMRSISIDSNDGLFQGNISVRIGNTAMLEQLMRKLREVKGVKSVTRLN